MNNDEKEINATREKLNQFKKSLGDSYNLGQTGEDLSPTNKNHMSVNMIDKNSSRSSQSNMRNDRNLSESMQTHPNQQYYASN